MIEGHIFLANDPLRLLSRVMRPQVRHVGVSNETSWGVTQFVAAAERAGLPKIVSIQNSYHLLNRGPFETDLVEVRLRSQDEPFAKLQFLTVFLSNPQMCSVCSRPRATLPSNLFPGKSEAQRGYRLLCPGVRAAAVQRRPAGVQPAVRRGADRQVH